MNPVNLKWVELETEIVKMKNNEYYKDMKIWQRIEKEPITLESIGKLIEQGWEVNIDTLKHFTGICNPVRKEIELDKSLDGYERDKVLFHEIVHAWYGLNDTGGHSNFEENGYIVEWIARKLRGDSDLLRHAIFSFGLEPKVYDKISYLAFTGVDLDKQFSFPFVKLDKQLSFPFVKEYFEELNKILVD